MSVKVTRLVQLTSVLSIELRAIALVQLTSVLSRMC